ncbi:MAG: tRNA glutamyl-Q(34) synthetase GluQRS [Gammaproteobacteria bacterium]|nr:tRNA glutamyl-Q(34) synthetase GluQRS [Gammaproteobacteria bacterium]
MSRTGRFAPSPTGDLHFGSLIAAVASFLQAKSRGGTWLVRIEDVDRPREVPGSAQRILADLQRFGMVSDRPVLYQSQRTAAYEQAITRLLDGGDAYWCGCSRSEMPASGVYPGTCSRGLPAGKSPRSIRLRVPAQPIVFQDEVQGLIRENLEETVGDFVIRRADGLAAYQLAVVVDDAFQQVTEIVRGADLLDSTARQIHLQGCLGLDTPLYAHHPVATGNDQKKLSKRHAADPVATHPPEQALEQALRFLGQPAPEGMCLQNLWRWALDHWQLSRIPRITITL